MNLIVKPLVLIIMGVVFAAVVGTSVSAGAGPLDFFKGSKDKKASPSKQLPENVSGIAAPIQGNTPTSSGGGIILKPGEERDLGPVGRYSGTFIVDKSDTQAANLSVENETGIAVQSYKVPNVAFRPITGFVGFDPTTNQLILVDVVGGLSVINAVTGKEVGGTGQPASPEPNWMPSP